METQNNLIKLFDRCIDTLSSAPDGAVATADNDLVREILAARRENSTIKAYRLEWSRFVYWLEQTKTKFNYPVSDRVVGSYFVWLHKEGYSRSTLQKARTAIGLVHGENENPCRSVYVRELLRGIFARDRRVPKKARPLSLPELVAICERLGEQGDYRSKRDRALLSLGWMGALRSAELVSLLWSDVTWSAEGVELQIRDSKTSKPGEAEIVALPFLATQYEMVCPVRNLRAIEPRNKKLDNVPIFHNAGYRPIVERTVSRIIDRAASLARLEAHYSSHALRRGFATHAARCGISEARIMRHGRWRSSAVAAGYVERAKLWTENPIRELLG